MPETHDSPDWYSLRHEATVLRLSKVFGMLAEKGIDALLIKGLAAARYHPDPSRRFSSDIDVSISPKESVPFGELSSLLSGHAVDIHLGFKHLDNQAWDKVLSRSESFEVNGVKVKVPCREDHIRILATHWLNDGGRRTDKLLDLVFCIEGAARDRGKEFDWELCLDGIGPVRRNWIAKAIGCLELFAGQHEVMHPFTGEETSLPEWFVQTVRKEQLRENSPLAYSKSLGEFLKGVRTKFPPNPIQATIEGEVPFEESVPRLAQLKSFLRRIDHSVRTYILGK